jgi:hypothetical protein
MNLNALICALVSFLISVAFMCGDFQRMPLPVMAGSVLAQTLGLWAISGLALFCSKKENVLRNWLLTLIALQLLIAYNRYSQPKEGNTFTEWHSYRIKRSGLL